MKYKFTMIVELTKGIRGELEVVAESSEEAIRLIKESFTEELLLVQVLFKKEVQNET